jgi:hypothetical protein
MKNKETVAPEDGANEAREYYTENAGMVLLHPFLAMFFARAGLTGDNIFKNDDSKVRALVLLGYLVSGHGYIDNDEQTLAKLMCGIEDVSVSASDNPITNEERELCDDLLENVVAQWDILKNSSIAALRESFLERKGKMIFNKDRYQLIVERKAFDILLDRLPWSIGIIKTPWMKNILYVEW